MGCGREGPSSSLSSSSTLLSFAVSVSPPFPVSFIVPSCFSFNVAFCSSSSFCFIISKNDPSFANGDLEDGSAAAGLVFFSCCAACGCCCAFGMYVNSSSSSRVLGADFWTSIPAAFKCFLRRLESFSRWRFLRFFSALVSREVGAPGTHARTFCAASWAWASASTAFPRASSRARACR